MDAEEDVAADDFELRIHRRIIENSGCPILQQELFRLLLIENTIVTDTPIVNRARYLRSHRIIVQAIADRDGESAEFLMKKHIQNGQKEKTHWFEK